MCVCCVLCVCVCCVLCVCVCVVCVCCVCVCERERGVGERTCVRERACVYV